MTTERHGLSVGIERVDSNIYLLIKAIGKLTHEDYEIITPMLDSAVACVRQPKVNALVDGTELEGWEMRAAWDDFRLGLKHGNEFHKIAIFGNRRWQQIVARVGSWFTSGEIRYFDEFDEAIDWLNQ